MLDVEGLQSVPLLALYALYATTALPLFHPCRADIAAKNGHKIIKGMTELLPPHALGP